MNLLSVVLALGVCTVACKPRQASTGGEGQQPSGVELAATRSGCLETAGRLVFSNLESAPETQDLSGFEVTLIHSASGWGGTFREARGELGRPQPLTGLYLDSLSHVVRFSMPDASDTSLFQGTVSCDSLWGTLKAYRTTPAVPMTLRRAQP
jgi:hypothetical protein